MRTLNLIVIFAFFFIANFNLSAQEPWSLEKCIDYAIEHNIQIKQTKLQTESSSSTLQQSKASLLPDLNASADYSLNYGRSIDPTTYEFTNNEFRSISGSIYSSVNLFNGLQTINTIRSNSYKLMADLEELEDVKYSITLQVATYYLQILLDKELLEVAKNQSEITRGQVERTKVLVEAGSLAKGNLLEMQAQLATEELNKINMENNLKTSYLNLTQLLELDTTDSFEILVPELADPSEKLMIDSAGTIFEKSQNLPVIKKQELLLRSSEKSLLVAKGSMSPTLYLSASYGSYYSSESRNPNGNDVYSFSDQFSDNRSFVITLGIRIPIFNNFSVKHSITQSKLGVENYKLQLQLTKNQLYKDIQTARNAAEAALAKFNASNKAVEAQEESFSYTQQKFDLGLVNSVDYNQAKNQLTKSQSDMVQAKFEFIFRINILNFYQGIPFQL